MNANQLLSKSTVIGSIIGVRKLAVPNRRLLSTPENLPAAPGKTSARTREFHDSPDKRRDAARESAVGRDDFPACGRPLPDAVENLANGVRPFSVTAKNLASTAQAFPADDYRFPVPPLTFANTPRKLANTPRKIANNASKFPASPIFLLNMTK